MLLALTAYAGLLAAEGRPARVAVRTVMAADLTPDARLAALTPFVRVGQSAGDAERAFGPPSGVLVNGPGFSDAYYSVPGGGHVWVSCTPDGRIYSIHYTDAAGRTAKAQKLPTGWPNGSGPGR